MQVHDTIKTQYKISDFLSWQASNSLILSPSFQRRSVWSAGAKSYLIDTIMRGLPVPVILLRDTKTDLKTLTQKREVIDGQQRLRTVISFIKPTILKDFNPARDSFAISKSHNASYAGLGFDALPAEERQRILDYQFSVHVFASGVDDREIIQIFGRINSSGYKLNPQELRNSQYFGEFKTSIFQLAAAELQRWRKWKIFGEDSISRMAEVELVSELAQLMIGGLRGKNQKSLDSLYAAKEKDFDGRVVFENRFQRVMDILDATFSIVLPDVTFSKVTVFFALFAAHYDFIYGLASPLAKVKPKPLPADYKMRVAKAIKGLKSDKQPLALTEALARRTTNLESRSEIKNFFSSSLFHA